MIDSSKLKGWSDRWRSLAQTNQPELKRLLVLTSIFFSFLLIFSLHRYFTYYASYDQGIFNQIFWNNLHGRWFQSSLTAGISADVVQNGTVPPVNFVHFAHHFVPTFLLWLPLYALFPHPVTLTVLQVGLMTAGGAMLYALARHSLASNLALLITAGYFSAIAVIGSTFANFYEHCQIPLFVFSMLLALEKQRWWLFWLMVLLVLGIREDTGIILFGIGVYLLGSRRHPRVGVALCLLSFAYVAVATNVIMASFSDDIPRIHLSSRFRQYVQGNPAPSTIDVLWGMITHPIEVLRSLLTPFDRRLVYLLGHWIPLAFIPALAPASWTMAGFPLLSLMLQSGQSALGITLRYAVAVVPGMFYGVILWWSHRPKRLVPKPEGSGWRSLAWAVRTRQLTPLFRKFWVVCLVVSIGSAILANPNQAFYFLLPESFNPWVFVTLPQQWQRTAIFNQMLSQIPADATVSATTHLIPQLSSRQKVIRLPEIRLKNENGQVEEMEYLVADLWRLQQYMPAFKNDRDRLKRIIPVLDQAISEQRYGVLDVQDKIVFLRKGVDSNPAALAAWKISRQELLASLENLRR